MSTIAATNLKNASSGSNNIVLNTDGTTTIAAPSNIIKSGTAVASTSGTAIDFTGIPSWVKRVTVMFDNVSLSATSNYLIQLGDSGGIENTGYNSGVIQATNQLTSTAGFVLTTGLAATSVSSGLVQISQLSSSANTWASFGNIADTNVPRICSSGGSKSLSGTIDRIRITTVNGTDTFDAGSINILWEG